MKKNLTSFLILLSSITFAQNAGSLDLSFGTGGKVVTSITNGADKAYGVAIQADGKILVAGFSTSAITGKDFSLLRYNADGTLDATFGTNGIVNTDVQLGSEDEAFSIALQADGKIVLAGYSDNGSNKNAALCRYQTNGNLDSTFGNNGKVLTDFENNQQDEIRVVKIHPLTGNIVVGGSSIISSSISKPVVARYLPNGSLDVSFDTDGIRLLWITNLDYQYLYSVEDIAVQPNGKITAVGWRDFTSLSWDADKWICRINSNGTVDNTFSNDGVNVYNGSFNGSDKAFGLLLRPDNSILMAGAGFLSTLAYDFTLNEISADGSNVSNSSNTDFGTSNDDIAYALMEDANGKFIIAGTSSTNTASNFALTRKNADYTTDNSFGTSGKTTTTFNGNQINVCYDAALQADNKIIAVGFTGNDIAIARYLGTAQAQLDAFQLTVPTNQAGNQNFATLSFNWTDAFGATGYELVLDTLSTFDGAPQTFTPTNSALTVNNLIPSTQYFWKVRATDGANFGQSSSVWSFTTKPLDNTSILDITSINFYVYPNPANDNIVIENSNLISETSFRIFSSAGILVKVGTISNSIHNVSIKELPAGVYYIQFESKQFKPSRLIKL